MAQGCVSVRLKASASCQNGGGPRCESFLFVRGNCLHPYRVKLPQGVNSWAENSFV